tara:strand:- start:140 stop:538 length:399 start_codon:yes stop_codon:yes gene_type:complete
MIDVSIYIKETGQIVSNRTVQNLDELSVLPDTHGYIQGIYPYTNKRWNGSEAVDYTPPSGSYNSGFNEKRVRQKRNNLLQESDWTQVSDNPLSDSKKAEWATYRQQLRDMMSSYTDSETNTVENITWPTRPS